MRRSLVLQKLEKQEEFRNKFSEFEEMKQIDSVATDDIGKIMKKIDVLCKNYLEAQKKLERKEQEYLEAKVELFIKSEEKDQLSQTLRHLIEKNERDKADKISSLLGKLEIKSKPPTKTEPLPAEQPPAEKS